MTENTEEDCRAAVTEALDALAEEATEPDAIERYLVLLAVAGHLPADELDEADADWIYRYASRYWQCAWDKVWYGPYKDWTPENVSNCYVKIALVYDWRFGVGEWERSLGRRPGSLLGTGSAPHDRSEG